MAIFMRIKTFQVFSCLFLDICVFFLIKWRIVLKSNFISGVYDGCLLFSLVLVDFEFSLSED